MGTIQIQLSKKFEKDLTDSKILLTFVKQNRECPIGSLK